VSATPRLVFVVDAGPAVGGGHVMRCLTLAQALTRGGARCAFAATPAASAVLETFAGPAIEGLSVPDGTAAELAARAASAARGWGADAAVIDHYGFAPAQDATVASAVRRTLAIDDLRRAHAACDLVLDSNLGRTAADYPGVAALIGPGFALVRPEFADLRKGALARRRARPAVARILVSLGLTDVGGITARVLQALRPALGEMALDVVVGGAAPGLPTLRAMAGGDPRITLHVDTSDMAGLTARADLAIGAGGSSTWERCCLGLPTLTLVLADNQRPNAQALAAVGATLVIEAASHGLDHQIRASLGALAASPAERLGLGEAAAELCDGAGAGRVAARLLRLIG